MDYEKRVVDAELDELLKELSAISIEGAKGVGKTATALRRAKTAHLLDDANVRSVAQADPRRLTKGATPILIDEWQLVPESWDVVRRSVDENAAPSSFLLTGSATSTANTHSGAGRIVSIRMRPLSLAERDLSETTVSVANLLSGRRPEISGRTEVSLEDYANEIVASGFPGLRGLSGRALRAQLDGYIHRILYRDFEAAGFPARNPAALRRWLTAYAAATSTTSSYEVIRDAATSGEGDKPAKSTTIPYRDVLERLWILDPLQAWLPTGNHIKKLAAPPKHHLADPALAARLLGVSTESLLSGEPATPTLHRDGTFLGHLFESLVTLSLRVYAQHSEASVRHLRTQGGVHEIDLVVVRPDQRVVAFEVKLARTVEDDDVRHLHWLRENIDDELLDAAIITTGPDAYRRPDGIAVIPAALLGP